jgi:hypothetical protein
MAAEGDTTSKLSVLPSRILDSSLTGTGGGGEYDSNSFDTSGVVVLQQQQQQSQPQTQAQAQQQIPTQVALKGRAPVPPSHNLNLYKGSVAATQPPAPAARGAQGENGAPTLAQHHILFSAPDEAPAAAQQEMRSY